GVIIDELLGVAVSSEVLVVFLVLVCVNIGHEEIELGTWFVAAAEPIDLLIKVSTQAAFEEVRVEGQLTIAAVGVPAAIFGLQVQAVTDHGLREQGLDIVFDVEVTAKAIGLVVIDAGTERGPAEHRAKRRLARGGGVVAECARGIDADTVADE